MVKFVHCNQLHTEIIYDDIHNNDIFYCWTYSGKKMVCEYEAQLEKKTWSLI